MFYSVLALVIHTAQMIDVQLQLFVRHRLLIDDACAGDKITNIAVATKAAFTLTVDVSSGSGSRVRVIVNTRK